MIDFILAEGQSNPPDHIERQSLCRYQILRIHTNRQEITEAFIHCEWRLFLVSVMKDDNLLLQLRASYPNND